MFLWTKGALFSVFVGPVLAQTRCTPNSHSLTLAIARWSWSPCGCTHAPLPWVQAVGPCAGRKSMAIGFLRLASSKLFTSLICLRGWCYMVVFSWFNLYVQNCANTWSWDHLEAEITAIRSVFVKAPPRWQRIVFHRPLPRGRQNPRCTRCSWCKK